MRLNLTFATSEDANNFLTKTGESDITSVHVGLINTAINSAGFVSGTVSGDAIEFLVKQSDGTWTAEVVADPFARILAGAQMEPSEAPIKMLASETWGQTRIENRYQPMVENLMIAEYNPQRRVEIIVVDSGINANHVEFADATIENLYKVPAFADYSDEVMHGTFVSSLIVGKTLGVNKKAVIKNVKISSASRKATLAELGAAFDAINSYHATCPAVPKIVNLSWRMPRSSFIDSKIELLIAAGIMVVTAAGNTAMNIDEITPAGTNGTYTVAGSTETDNELCAVYGTTKKLSVYAPGENISGANFATTDQYMLGTGSSFSAAFASAVAGIYFGLGATCPVASDVATSMNQDSTPGAISVNENVSAIENRLLHRPDASTIVTNTILFMGHFTLSEITTELAQRTGTDKASIDTKSIFPVSISTTASYSFNFNDAETQSLMSNSVIDGSIVRILVPTDTVLPAGTKVKQVSFKVNMTSDGLSMVSPLIYYFITSDDADYATDVAPQIEELDAESMLDFAAFGFGYNSKR
jgi:hypothetical protein